jgi:sugar (pentulose or hexulose) kinase
VHVSSKCQYSSGPAHGRGGDRPRGVADAVAAFVTYQPEEHRPDPERHQAYGEAYRRYRDVYYALKPVFGQEAVG